MWCFFFFKQKTAYDMRISDWSSDVCSSDLVAVPNGWSKGKQGLGIAGTDAARTTAIESRQDAISKILKQGGLEKKDEKTGKTFIEQLSSEQRLSLENEMRKLWYDRSKQGFVQLIPGELAPMEFGRIVDGIVEDRKSTRLNSSH